MNGKIEIDAFLALTLGILVFFAGLHINQRISILRDYNIPEPVTGGILASLLAMVLFLATGSELDFDLYVRDVLLVYFFTAIGLNARLSDLIEGGRPLVVLLGLTLGYIFIQNLVGTSIAAALDQPTAIGVLTGSASLIGGHGTTIAWAPKIAADHEVPNALELGIASATLGLVVASLLGGPIAKFLLARYRLTGGDAEIPIVGLPSYDAGEQDINHVNLMRVILVVHVAMVLGYILNSVVAQAGLKLPLFVSCLLVAIVLSNTVPHLLPKLIWPARTRSLALVSEFSLGLFIAMSLMSMKLWSMADLAGPLLVILGIQALVTVAFIVLVLFPAMGRNYLAAVLSAGFAGFALGATPTAIANMTAVTKTHGPAPTAFIILPLVGAFFVDLTNAAAIQLFLSL